MSGLFDSFVLKNVTTPESSELGKAHGMKWSTQHSWHSDYYWLDPVVLFIYMTGNAVWIISVLSSERCAFCCDCLYDLLRINEISGWGWCLYELLRRNEISGWGLNMYLDLNGVFLILIIAALFAIFILMLIVTRRWTRMFLLWSTDLCQ